MSSTVVPGATSKGMLWTGRVISALVVLFMLFDCITKIIKLPQVIDASAKMGFTVGMVVGVGWTVEDIGIPPLRFARTVSMRVPSFFYLNVPQMATKYFPNGARA